MYYYIYIDFWELFYKKYSTIKLNNAVKIKIIIIILAFYPLAILFFLMTLGSSIFYIKLVYIFLCIHFIFIPINKVLSIFYKNEYKLSVIEEILNKENIHQIINILNANLNKNSVLSSTIFFSFFVFISVYFHDIFFENGKIQKLLYSNQHEVNDFRKIKSDFFNIKNISNQIKKVRKYIDDKNINFIFYISSQLIFTLFFVFLFLEIERIKDRKRYKIYKLLLELDEHLIKNL